ncbi:MAG: NAD(P)H-hydrate dehydratase [Chloroflexi bacterium]|nr:NAD(P)H-hydrate dehydratase [Chloroflexota bacterium]
MKVVTVAQMRELEARAGASGISTDALMARAGLAVARSVRTLLGGAAGRRSLVLVGPGNNGGDGLVAARHLRDWGAEVRLYLLAERRADANLERTRARSLPECRADQDSGGVALDAWLGWAECVLDAVLGTGRARPLEGVYRTVLTRSRETRARRADLRVVALDLPTGLDADTGRLDPAALPADLTIALAAPKMGHLTFPGAGAVGRLEVVDIGIPPDLAADIPVELLTATWAARTLPPRPADAHKGTFGRVLVIAGSSTYIGAAALVGQAAGRCGAGLVTLAVAHSLVPVLAAKLTEPTYLPLPEDAPGHIGADAAPTIVEVLGQVDALVVGCGIGLHPATEAFIGSLLESLPPSPPPLVLDADALTALSRRPGWWEQVRGDVVLTPHPGEMGRLLGSTTAAVQQDRLTAAREAATRWGTTIVLKGAGTVVAAPDGRLHLSGVATPALATAGTGDCLAGSMGALLSQGLSAFAAASLAVYLTGTAGLLVQEEVGRAGAIASDLLPRLPQVWQRLQAGAPLPGIQ